MGSIAASPRRQPDTLGLPAGRCLEFSRDGKLRSRASRGGVVLGRSPDKDR
jgi:hypothetical protein